MEVKIKIYPNMGDCYYVILNIPDDEYDLDEYIVWFINLQLKNVEDWKIIERK